MVFNVNRAIDAIAEGREVREVTNKLLEGNRKVSQEIMALHSTLGKAERLESAFQESANILKRECRMAHRSISRSAEKYQARCESLLSGLEALGGSRFKSDMMMNSVEEASSSLSELGESLSEVLGGLGEMHDRVSSVQGKVNKVFRDQDDDDDEEPDADMDMDGDGEDPEGDDSGLDLPGSEEPDSSPDDEFPPEDDDEEPEDDEEFPPEDDEEPEDDDEEPEDDDEEF